MCQTDIKGSSKRTDTYFTLLKQEEKSKGYKLFLIQYEKKNIKT